MMELILMQGLGGGHLVTQGWSWASPSTSLITQGLYGPGFFLQGLASGGGASSFAVSGGVASGGAAAISLATITTATGGLSLGSSPQPVGLLRQPSVGGGQAIGGAAG